MRAKIEFKIASEDWEFEQINQLNYKTFVDEIPQHQKNDEKSLLDKFHSENTYIICVREQKLLGMMAVRDKRPFSLDHKINDLDSYLPDYKFACEFRLLSIEQEFRNIRVIQGLLLVLAKFADEKGYDIALISANVNRLRFYKHFGFEAFGPVVGADGARYQPMYLTLQSSLEFRKRSKILSRIPSNFAVESKKEVNLLPGPVDISGNVKEAFSRPPKSHRSKEFKADFNLVKNQLRKLTGAKSVEILLGSGSLANDAIAAQLSLENTKGLILSNGEFGERLIDQAQRMGLDFDKIQIPWGETFDYLQIEETLNNSEIKWLWAVHCETSTGMLNDLDTLKEIAFSNGTRMCLDCVSSLGLIPTNLNGIYLASGVSGKGLASYPGLSFVFYNHEIQSSDSIPRSIDIGFYAKSDGIPSTISSNLVYALGESLRNINIKNRFEKLIDLSIWAREQISDIGFKIISPGDSSTPAVITISLPDWLSSSNLGAELQKKGVLVHWRSSYLIQRNWIQIAFMSRNTKQELAPLFEFLSSLKSPLRKAQ